MGDKVCCWAPHGPPGPAAAPSGEAALLGSPFGVLSGTRLLGCCVPGCRRPWQGAGAPQTAPGAVVQGGASARAALPAACPALPGRPRKPDPLRAGPWGGWWDPPWGKGTPSAGSRTGGPRFALTGGERGPEPEQCTARSPATRARMLWSMCQGSQVKDPQCSRAGGLQQHGAGRHYRH